jgi:uncharacterized membrane protein YhfC
MSRNLKFSRRWALTLWLALAWLLTSCAAPAANPLVFGTIPWSDGETSLYDVRDRNGVALGAARWTSRQTTQGWSQSSVLTIAGRPDQGEVLLDETLRPIRSWRENAAGRTETEYGPDNVVVRTSGPTGATQVKTLAAAPGMLDNDQVLQAQRALVLAENAAFGYVNLVPSTATALSSTLRVMGAETVSVPAGSFPAWHAEMHAGGSTHDVWYGQQSPYPMLKYRNRGSGAEFTLRAIGTDVTAVQPGQPTLAPETVSTEPPPINVPLLLATLLIQLPLMLLFPLVLGAWIRHRYHVGWAVFAAGTVTFIASQVVHLPLNYALGLLGGGRGVGVWPIVPLALAAGLSAALCEEGARWLALRIAFKKIRTWPQGLQYGAGHGGVEAIIFGLLALVNLVSMIALRSATDLLAAAPEGTLEQARYGMATFWGTPWTLSVVGGLERVFAITLQIAMASLVVRAVARRQIGYLLAAIAMHTMVDAWAVWAIQTLGMTATEIGLALMAAGALWLIRWLREPAVPTTQPDSVVGAAAADFTLQVLSVEELARRADASRYE